MFEISKTLCTELTDEQASTVQGGLSTKKGLHVCINRIQTIKAGADKSNLFSNGDEVYVTIDGKREPKVVTDRSMKVCADVGSIGTIKLYDEDRFSDDDYLGGFTVYKPTNNRRVRVSGSGSIYDVYYSVY